MAERSEYAVAIVNGLLVMVLPLAFALLATVVILDSNTSVTVHAPGASRVMAVISPVLSTVVVVLPFALLAGWRSFVYARRWRDQSDRGWRAVAEAGVCGLAVALIVLAPGIVRRPRDAPPYVVF